MEHLVLGQGGERDGGSDRVVIAQHYLAVLDGVTPRGRARDERLVLDGMSVSAWAATTLATALATLPAELAMGDAVSALSETLYERTVHAGIDPAAWGWPVATQAAIYSVARREVWRVGDISIAVNGARLPDTPTPVDAAMAAVRAAANEAALLTGATIEQLRAADPAAGMLEPLRVAQVHFRNHPDVTNPWVHAVVDGQAIPAGLLTSVGVNAGDEVVLASDGYPTPAPSLAAAEAALADLAVQDPLCIRRHPGLRAFDVRSGGFDDRAYLRFVV